MIPGPEGEGRNARSSPCYSYITPIIFLQRGSTMSIIRVINNDYKYYNTDAKEKTIEYILNPKKTKSGFIGGVAVSAVCPAESMMFISEHFNKTDGVQLRHYVISFDKGEINKPKIANDIACRVSAYIGQQYQIVFAVHEDEENLHIHFVANTVSYIDGHRYRGTYAEFYEMINYISNVLSLYKIKNLMYVK